MGSERFPSDLFSASISQVEDDVELLFLATDEEIPENSSFSFHRVDEVITMEDDPIRSVISKRQSSLIQGLELLKQGAIDAFITSGNTGALIAGSTALLTKMGSMERAGLLATLPSRRGEFIALDVGGMLLCRPNHLLQFARFGSAYISVVNDIEMPRVGLLNVGSESVKGTEELRAAYRLLAEDQPHFEFIGNVEPDQIFEDNVDVVVTDGFSGNVLLKTCEGISSLIFQKLKENLLTQEGLYLVEKTFCSAEYPGALVSGIESVVLKCHGHSSDTAIQHSIQLATRLVRLNALSQISSKMV